MRHTYPNGDQVAFVSTMFDARVPADVEPRPDDDETPEVAWLTHAALSAGRRHAPGSRRDESLPRLLRAILTEAGIVGAPTAD